MSEHTDSLDDQFSDHEADRYAQTYHIRSYEPPQDVEAALNAEAWKWKRSGKRRAKNNRFF